MNLANSQDILNTALRFAGEITDAPPSENVSEYRTAALGYLNRIYLALLAAGNEFDVEMGEPFSWAISPQPGIFVIAPSIDVSASMAQGATVGSFATAPVDEFGNLISVQGRYIRFTNLSDVYRITAHISGATSFTIDFAYIQASQVGTNATLYALDYLIGSNILRLVSPFRLYQIQSNIYNGEIMGSDMAAMRREFPIAFLQTRYPDRFCVKFQDASINAITVQINTNPLDYARVEYDYVPVPTLLTDAPTSIPIVPLEHRMTLAYGVAYYLCTDKNDNRAQNYQAQTAAGMVSIVKAQKRIRVDLNRERGRITPRMDLLKRRSVPWWWGRF